MRRFALPVFFVCSWMLACQPEVPPEAASPPVSDILFPPQAIVLAQDIGLHALPSGAWLVGAAASPRQLSDAFGLQGLLPRLQSNEKQRLDELGAWLGISLDKGLDAIGVAESAALGFAWYGQDDALVIFLELRDSEAFARALVPLEELLGKSGGSMRLLHRAKRSYLLVGLSARARLDSLQHRIELTERASSLGEDPRLLRALRAGRRGQLVALWLDLEALRLQVHTLLVQSAEALQTPKPDTPSSTQANDDAQPLESAEPFGDDPYAAENDGLVFDELDEATIQAMIEELRWRRDKLDQLYAPFDSLLIGVEPFQDGLWLQGSLLRKERGQGAEALPDPQKLPSMERRSALWDATRAHHSEWDKRFPDWPSSSRLVLELEPSALRTVIQQALGLRDEKALDKAIASLGPLGEELASLSTGRIELGFTQPWNTWTEELPLPELAPALVLHLSSAERADELWRSLFVRFDAQPPEGVHPEKSREAFSIAQGDFVGIRLQLAGDRLIVATALLGRDESWQTQSAATRLSPGQESERNKLFRLGSRVASLDVRWGLDEMARLGHRRVAAMAQRVFCATPPTQRSPAAASFCELAQSAESARLRYEQSLLTTRNTLSSALLGLDLVALPETARLDLYGVLFLDHDDWSKLARELLITLPLPFEAISLERQAEREESVLLWRSTFYTLLRACGLPASWLGEQP